MASLLALNGPCISEALGADVEDLDFERGHRTLKILLKGGKRAIIPLAPRTSRVFDLYLDERTTGPIFLGAKGGRMDRYAAWLAPPAESSDRLGRYRVAISPEPARYRAAVEAQEAAEGATVVAAPQPVRNCTATSVGFTSAK